ncbi:MAG TPA: prepilin-type N-terminal cleavage/methylation domain-containing protein [Longimicrobium sp.]|jgi:prepilin-type N-terminal cleavage/methylation domain-containing protein
MHVLRKGIGGRMARTLRSRQGFTMIELMVVVVVIAILATAIGFTSTKLIGNSIDATMKSDAKAIHTALVDHFVDWNRFPSTIGPSTGTASATTMLFDPSDGNVLAIASGSTTTQVTVTVTNPKKPGYTCSITARPSGTAKPVCA